MELLFRSIHERVVKGNDGIWYPFLAGLLVKKYSACLPPFVICYDPAVSTYDHFELCEGDGRVVPSSRQTAAIVSGCVTDVYISWRCGSESCVDPRYIFIWAKWEQIVDVKQYKFIFNGDEPRILSNKFCKNYKICKIWIWTCLY